MAAKWTSQLAVAAGVAAGTGAAQLGLGYGLGVVVWQVAPAHDDSVWLGSLGWATWIAASSTVFGAMVSAALRGQPTRPSGPLRLGLSFFAGLGALLTVALIALPARSAVRTGSMAPQNTAALYAAIGIVLGIMIAYWAVVSGPVAANMIGTAAYLWTLAATAIVVELTGGRPAATYLTSWQFAPLSNDQRYGTIYWPSALITVLAAFLLGVIAATPAVRRGDHRVGTALSGAVGPLLVAAAFMLLAPQLTSATGQLQSAYLIAPYAVLAGLAGSALMVSRGQRAQLRGSEETPQVATGKASVRKRTNDDDDEPTAELKPTTGRSKPPRQRDDKPTPPPAKPTPPPARQAPSPARQAPSPAKPAPSLARPTPPPTKPVPPAGQAESGQPKSSFTDRLRRGRGRTQDEMETAEIKSPSRSTVAAPPTTPPIAKINPPGNKN